MELSVSYRSEASILISSRGCGILLNSFLFRFHTSHDLLNRLELIVCNDVGHLLWKWR